MRPLWAKCLVGALMVALWALVTNAQNNRAKAMPNEKQGQTDIAGRDNSLNTLALENQAKQDAAESILAREEAATGRAFDPTFRTAALAKLASRTLDELQSQSNAGLGIEPDFLGSSGSDLVYNPITPCRIIDTRVAGGAITPGTNRSFVVAGTTGFPAQGGTSGGCGIPHGPATAAVINFVSVSPPGPGDLRITPFGSAMPLASILNFTPGLNIANGPTVTLCNPANVTCTSDITLQADGSPTHIVADVQGFFAAPATITAGVCGANDVYFGGHCYYLDGSGGVCDPGYSLVPESALSTADHSSNTVASKFVGLNYKHQISSNCCIFNSAPAENWGMTNHCNVNGPFTSGDPALGGASCNAATIFSAAQLTLCGK